MKAPQSHPWRVYAPGRDKRSDKEREDRAVPPHANPLRRYNPNGGRR